ncbi:hypothetical protein JXQ31_01870 [candidate division KSB1 bacterium]|nr:hypothetical protein [candidate division KSB1 bacterium]
MNFKKQVILFAFFLFSTVYIFAGAVITEFRADAGLNQVELKWVVSSESNLKGYNVYRSFDGVNFVKLNSNYIPVKAGSGEKTYKYIDRSVFKPDGRTFYYKIEFVNINDSKTEYEKVVETSPEISSARHTWGSIKAMFR